MAAEQQLYILFDELAICYTVYEHEPAFTVEQAKQIAAHVPGTHTKNLFLKDDKKRLWLFVAQCDAKINLKQVAKALDAKGLRFAQPELLEKYLGVTPGSVTPFGLLNDNEHAVHVVLDDSLLNAQLVDFHPLRNTASVTLTSQDLVRCIKHIGNKLTLYNLKNNNTKGFAS